MHRAQITIHSKNGSIVYDHLHTGPSNWNEMTRQHLLAWGSALASALPVSQAKLILASKLLQIPKDVFICVRSFNRDRIAGTTDFLFEKNQLDNWLIPSIWCGVFKYHGPKHRLVNITADEFEKCEHCYEQFGRTKNTEYLDTLAAILYRPCRFWGVDDDIRVKLTTNGYVRRSKRFKRLPSGLKTAIYLNYEGCRHYLHNKFRAVFMKPAGKGAAGPAELTPWPKIIESASNDIFGPYESTRSTRLHVFLSRLATRIKEMEASEAPK